jgi:hypothetical protein
LLQTFFRMGVKQLRPAPRYTACESKTSLN